MELMLILAAVLALVVLDIAALRWGYDSRQTWRHDDRRRDWW